METAFHTQLYQSNASERFESVFSTDAYYGAQECDLSNLCADRVDTSGLAVCEALTLRFCSFAAIRWNYLPRLRRLDVSGSYMTELSTAGLENLEWLDISGTKLISLDTRCLGSLRCLIAACTRLTQLDAQPLVQLDTLHLSGIAYNDAYYPCAVAFECLTRLKTLHTMASVIDQIPPNTLIEVEDLEVEGRFADFAVFSTHRMRRLTLISCDNAADAHCFPNLEVLELINCADFVLDFGQFPRLRRFKCDNTTIEVQAAEMQALESLDVSGCQADQFCINYLTCLRELHIFWTVKRQLDLILHTELRALTLYNTGLTHLDVSEMRQLEELSVAGKTLHLSANRQMPALRVFEADVTAFDGLSADRFPGIRKLSLYGYAAAEFAMQYFVARGNARVDTFYADLENLTLVAFDACVIIFSGFLRLNEVRLLRVREKTREDPNRAVETMEFSDLPMLQQLHIEMTHITLLRLHGMYRLHTFELVNVHVERIEASVLPALRSTNLRGSSVSGIHQAGSVDADAGIRQAQQSDFIEYKQECSLEPIYLVTATRNQSGRESGGASGYLVRYGVKAMMKMHAYSKDSEAPEATAPSCAFLPAMAPFLRQATISASRVQATDLSYLKHLHTLWIAGDDSSAVIDAALLPQVSDLQAGTGQHAPMVANLHALTCLRFLACRWLGRRFPPMPRLEELCVRLVGLECCDFSTLTALRLVEVDCMIVSEVVLGRLPELESLRISSMRSSDVQCLDVSGLPALRVLVLDNIRISELRFGLHPNLSVVKMDSSIAGPLDIQSLQSLVYLSVTGCASSLAAGIHPALRYLCLNDTQLDELHIDGMPALEQLKAAGSKIRFLHSRQHPRLTDIDVRGAAIAHLDLRGMPCLRSVWASGTALRYIGLAEVSRLRVLSIDDTPVRFARLRHRQSVVHVKLPDCIRYSDLRDCERLGPDTDSFVSD